MERRARREGERDKGEAVNENVESGRMGGRAFGAMLILLYLTASYYPPVSAATTWISCHSS